jgi:hypothetical protein
MKRQTLVELAVFAALVALGACSRIYFQDLPNFAPVSAIALFAGFFFRSWLVAAAAPLAAMAASDVWIGGYDPVMMGVVYLMLALPVAARGFLRTNRERGPLAGATALCGCTLAASLLFFLVTNLAWWLTSDMYEKSLAGLVRNYAQALPFFRYTLAGDVFFGCLLFGSHKLALVVWGATQRERKAKLDAASV